MLVCTLKSKFLYILLFAVLFGCSAEYYQPQERNFYNHLRGNYVSYADYKRENYDWMVARKFDSKAKKIEKGEVVLPMDVSDDEFVSKGVSALEFDGIKQRMSLVMNNGTSKIEYPEETANLQFYYDCWVAEENSSGKYSQMARCKQGFDDTLGYLEFKLLILTKEQRKLIAKELDKTGDDNVYEYVKPKKYVVNFDFDSSVITDDASRVIWDLLNDLKKISGDYVVDVTGHADRKGNNVYNQKLSEVRTETVKHYLVENGVDESKIKTHWNGEIDPRVITRNDFKEALNRRVTIKIKRLDNE